MIELEPEVKKNAAWGCYGSAQALSGLGVQASSRTGHLLVVR